MKNEEDKQRILNNLRKLKGNKEFKGLSVTEDLTQSERKMVREWASKAEEKNKNEVPGSNVIWRVRGSPKNGLRLKKFLRQDQNQ